MNKAGFTAYLDMEDALSEIGASDAFNDAVLEVMDEAAIQYEFTFTNYRAATRIDPEEPIEIEWLTDANVEAMSIIGELIRTLDIKFVVVNDELHKLWKQLETIIWKYMEGIGSDKAYEVAWDWKQEKLAQEADYRYDEWKERLTEWDERDR